MIVAYGSHTHAIAEVGVSRTRTPIRGLGGIQTGYSVSWRLEGFLIAADAASLRSAASTLRTDYATDGQNLTLYLDDGTTVVDQIVTADSVSGTQIKVIEQPDYKGAELSSFHRYLITVDAEFALDDTQLPAGLLSFQESISIRGTGGPAFVILEPLNGSPIKQLVKQRTKVTARQSGSAVGATRCPTPPVPLWPQHLVEPDAEINEKSPERMGPVNNPTWRKFEISWAYSFESIGPLNGHPHLWL